MTTDKEAERVISDLMAGLPAPAEAYERAYQAELRRTPVKTTEAERRAALDAAMVDWARQVTRAVETMLPLASEPVSDAYLQLWSAWNKLVTEPRHGK